MTRAIYLMVGIGLVMMSVIIPIFDFSVGEPYHFPTLIILSIDYLMLIGWLKPCTSDSHLREAGDCRFFK